MFSTCDVIQEHTLRVCLSVYSSITCTRSPLARRSQNFRCSEFGEISSHSHQHTLAHITLTMLYSDRDAIVAGLPLHSAGLPLYTCHFCDGHCLAFGSSDGRTKKKQNTEEGDGSQARLSQLWGICRSRFLPLTLVLSLSLPLSKIKLLAIGSRDLAPKPNTQEQPKKTLLFNFYAGSRTVNFETKNRAIFLERLFGRGITAREQLSLAKNSKTFFYQCSNSGKMNPLHSQLMVTKL